MNTYSAVVPLTARENDPTTASKRNIIIQPLDYGYIVDIGCQRIAVESKDKLIKNLKAYMDNPVAFEKSWNKNKKLQ